MKFFTKENSRLAALIHGDPNEVHLNQRFGKTIAPGLMQLQGFIALAGWKEDTVFDVDLTSSIVVPSDAEYYYSTSSGYSIKNANNTFAKAKIRTETKFNIQECSQSYKYRLTKENINPECLDWRNYNSIPVELVREIVPSTDARTLERISCVGVAANALVRYLVDNPSFHEEMFFPQAREDGKYAVLEEKLVLHMGESNGELSEITLGIAPERQIDDKTFVASIQELNGLYTLDIYLKKIPKRVFERLLRA